MIVIDLRKTFSLPYQAARDIAGEINEETLENVNRIIKEELVTKQYECQTDYWVDLESIGNVTAIKSKDLAFFLSSKIPIDATLFVHYFELDDDNKLFLDFLARHVPQLTIHFCKTEPLEFYPRKIPEEIIQFAWLATNVGSIHLATRILKHYYSETKNVAYLVALQYIRLVSGYFLEAVNEYYDDELFMDTLFYIKAYCGVLTNNIEIAGKYFEKMGMYVGMPLTDLQSLYQMNIFALYQHRLGHAHIAFELEHKIENKLNSENEVHTQIHYINSLNLARLYRFSGQLDKSKYYFDLAYASINGLMSEADHVYININYASLYEKSGDIENAFSCWLRAALHWMTMRYPEALGWRIGRAILKKEIHPGKVLPLDEVCEVFYKKLFKLAQQLEIDLVEKNFEFDLIPIKNFIGEFTQAHFYGKENLVGLIAASSYESVHWLYCQPQDLKQLVLSYLATLGCLPDEKQFNTLVVDTDHDTHMPVLLKQAIKRCLLLNISVLNWDGKNFNKVILMGVGIFLLGMSMWLLNFIFFFSIAIIACIINTIGEILFFSVSQLLCYNNAPNQKKGQALGIYRAVYATSRVLAPVVGAFVYDTYGSQSLWLLFGLVGSIFLLLCSYFKNEYQF